LDGPNAMPWAQEVLCSSLVLTSAIITVLAFLRNTAEREPIFYCGSVATWAAFSRLVYLIAIHEPFGMQKNAAVTFSWILYAVLILCVGFVAKARALRFTSFATLALTIAKVMLLDLAGLDPGIRVALLLMLGLAMLGGGYLYIRTQRPGASQA
jgi:uncharacterized membrane protein